MEARVWKMYRLSSSPSSRKRFITIDIMALDVPEFLTRLLEKYDLPAKYIKAEITESAYAEEDETIGSTVKRLRESGFLVMTDDFGSGYTNSS